MGEQLAKRIRKVKSITFYPEFNLNVLHIKPTIVRPDFSYLWTNLSYSWSNLRNFNRCGRYIKYICDNMISLHFYYYAELVL